jgi:hypothetical protein
VNQPQSTLTGITEFQAFADSLAPPPADADFDGDDDVDGQDFLIWQRGLGVGNTPGQGDADDNGVVNGADLAVWRQQFGGGAAIPAVGAVPEPTGLALAAASLLGLTCCRRARR